jgi:PIN like domain
LNFVLDENLPRAFARSLNALVRRHGFSVTHVRDVVGERTLDVDWIPLVGKEGGAVISGDRRLATREHELLALRSSGVITFILAPGWSKLPFWEKAWLLTRWYPRLAEIASHSPPGSIYRVPHKHAPGVLKPYRSDG